VARKNFIWDVALVAASFCVQFDGDVKSDTSSKKWRDIYYKVKFSYENLYF